MKKKIICGCLLVLSAAMITAGVMQNQPDSVYSKAVRVCLECVGIG